MSLMLWANVTDVSIIDLFATLFLYWSSEQQPKSWHALRILKRHYQVNAFPMPFSDMRADRLHTDIRRGSGLGGLNWASVRRCRQLTEVAGATRKTGNQV